MCLLLPLFTAIHPSLFAQFVVDDDSSRSRNVPIVNLECHPIVNLDYHQIYMSILWNVFNNLDMSTLFNNWNVVINIE